MPVRVVIGGPRGSGKSTLVASLFSQLQRDGVNVSVHEIDVYSDTINCILGRKLWADRRKRVKAWFDPTIKRRIHEFSSDEHDLVLGDLPGKITNQFLPKMVEPADKAVVVAKDWEGIEQWQEFFAHRGIPVLLRVISCLSEPPVLPLTAPTVTFMFGLNRAVLQTPEIRSLARQLYSLTTPARMLVPA